MIKRLIGAAGRYFTEVYYLPFYLFSFIFLQRKPLLIVTGSDSSHYRSMLQLLNSIKIFEKKASLIVYDLGLTSAEIKLLLHLFPNVVMKRFEFEKYPDYYQMKNNCGSYAWKPAIISKEFEALPKNKYMCWLDAGCFVTRKMLLIRAAVFFYGFYSPLSGPIIHEWTHKDTINGLEGNEVSGARMLSGGLLGIRKTQRNIQLMQAWARAGNDPKLIAPEGSNKGKHRYDQSLLSLLFYKTYKTTSQPMIQKNWLEVLAHKDIG